MKGYKLTDELREKLKNPIGELHPSVDEIIDEIKGAPKVIAVGDAVTQELLKRGIIPDLSIVDGKVMREPFIPEKKPKYPCREVRVKNDAGTVSAELRESVKNSMDRRGRIFVYGEEDLATLAAIEFAPNMSLVLYGQPGQGVVLVRVTNEKKEEVRRYYEQMIEI